MHSYIIVYLAPGQAALGNIVCRQDTLSPTWGSPLQQRGGLEEKETIHTLNYVKN